MHKILTIFCLFASSFVYGQANSLVSPENASNGSAINIAVSAPDERSGNDFFSEADRDEKKGDLFSALTLFGKAAFEYNTSHQLNDYGSALMRMSNVHLLLSNYTEAEEVILNVALKNYSRIHNVRGEMDAYRQLAKIYLVSNKLTEALWFSTQQGILALQIRNSSGYIDSILGVVSVKIKKKQFSLAKLDLNRAERYAKTTKNVSFRSEISTVRNQIISIQNHKK
jgi:tetratricopeptide (TPR) repeat protein